MKKYILFSILFLLSLCLLSATPGDTVKNNVELTPFNNRYDYRTAGIKVRVLPFIIGNGMGVSALAGGEWGFLKNNSIGLDFLYNGFLDHDDYNPGPSDNLYHRKTAAHLNYNHYWGFHKLREKHGVAFYTGLTVRKGATNIREERGLGATKDSIINTYTDYFCYGGQIGLVFTLESRPFAFNINIPVYYNNKIVNYTDSKNPISNNTQKYSTVDFRFEINFYWWFMRKDKSIYLNK